MSRRTNPVDQVVAFFETAPLEQAATVLTIVRGIVARRQPPAWPDAKTKRLARKAERTRKGGPLLDGAEAVPAHVKTSRGGLTEEDLQS